MTSRTARAAALLFLFASLSRPAPATAQEVVFLTRHAEKADGGKDPSLSQVGRAHAKALAALLADAGVDAVFTSDRKRTQQTAEAIAAARKIVAVEMPAGDCAGLVARIRKDHAADVVLVVGHSNTIPEILKAFGAEEAVTIDEKEYGTLFVLVPREGKPPLLTRLRY